MEERQKRLKQFLEEVHRVRLMPAVTPLHRLERLEQEWKHKGVYIKRDDMTGVGLGGNKIRSLEYLLGEALAEGCDKVLVAGPGQSNLCMLTAAACARLGLDCEVVHNCSKPDFVRGNLLLNQILGVKSHFLGEVDSVARNRYMEELFGEYEKQGKNPYIVRNGATTGRGALGYTAAVLELMAQCEEQGIHGLTLFVPGGNGGVATGLVYGNALMGQPFKLVIVSVEDDGETLMSHIRETIGELEELTGIPCPAPVHELCEIAEEYRGDGWGVNTKESSEEVLEFAKQEGIFVENVYNSKVLVGMKQWIKTGRVEGNACYLHTGGLGSLFAQY